MNYGLPGLAPMPVLGMVQLQLMQMVPFPGKLAAAGRVASAQADASDQRALDIAWQLRSETAAAFYDLYSTDRRLAVARETLGNLRDVEKSAEAMYRVGDGRQADVLRAQLEIAKMAGDTLRMAAMRDASLARIAALTNGGTIAVADVPLLPRFPQTVPPMDSIVALAIAARPMIRGGLDQLRAAEASENLARREIWPDLQAGVQYGQRSAPRGDSGMKGTDRMGSLMLGASIPIFARGRQLRMRDEAYAMKQMASADVEAMRAETRGKIGEAYAAILSARDLAQLYRTTVLPQAEATVASAFAAYRVGTVDFFTLLDARMTLNKFRQELFSLESDEGMAWADLEMLTGRVLFDPNVLSATDSIARGGK